MNGKLVLVRWVDSCTDSGWFSGDLIGEKHHVVEIISIGHLLKKDKQCMTIAQSRSEHDHYDNIISIPKGCIKRIQPMQIAKEA